MSCEGIVSIVVGIINIFALIFVGIQTNLNRKTLKITERTFSESMRSQQIINLRSVYYVWEVRSNLNNWASDFKWLIKEEKNIINAIRNDSGYKLKVDNYHGSDRLVQRSFYTLLPDWLQVMIMAGAQYYYNCVCLVELVNSDRTVDCRVKLFQAIVERATEGLDAINDMQIDLNKPIPKWYRDSPSSKNDRDFLY
ncbi:hypothetical protein [Dehalococcoides mccartyi]|uniref:hypothetical protein n=1 Tax=Dehalococcoides mccartyi TaxID=61435 RepID=UPI000804A66E|nr:hypothetical protein [Dehalococcoides mccartyi]OBW61584.1 MAG: hypothetical protein A9181_00860 [Dehalococcoides mccartyi]